MMLRSRSAMNQERRGGGAAATARNVATTPFQPSLELTFRGHRQCITSASFHPNHAQLLTGSYDGTVMLWSVKPTQRALRFVAGVSAVQGSNTARPLTSATVGSARRCGSGAPPRPGRVLDSCFSGSGSLFASVGSDGCARLWIPSVKGEHSVIKAHASGCARSVALSHSTSSAATFYTSTAPFESDGVPLTTTAHHLHGRIGGGSNQLLMLTGGDDKSAKLWDVAEQKFIMSFSGHQNWVRSVAFGPAHARLAASAGDDKAVFVWDMRMRQATQSARSATHAFFEHTDAVTTVDFHPDGNCVAAGSADHSINLWDLRMGGLLQHYGEAHQGLRHGRSGDAVTGTAERTSTSLGRAAGGVSSVRFSPNGSWLLSAGHDGDVKLWDLKEGYLYCTVSAHEGPVLSARFSASGSQFVTAGSDATVMLWRSGIPEFTPRATFSYLLDGQENQARPRQLMSAVSVPSGDVVHACAAAYVSHRLEKSSTPPPTAAAAPAVAPTERPPANVRPATASSRRTVTVPLAPEEKAPPADQEVTRLATDSPPVAHAEPPSLVHEEEVPRTHPHVDDDRTAAPMESQKADEPLVPNAGGAWPPGPAVGEKCNRSVFTLLEGYVSRIGDVEQRMSALEQVVATLQANSTSQLSTLQQLVERLRFDPATTTSAPPQP